MQLGLILFVFLIIVSVLLTGFIRRLSINFQLYDLPNKRSSHTNPTPKAGGISIILPVLICIILLFLINLIELSLFISLFVGTLIISVTGFIDDYKNLSVQIRAIIYFLASTLSFFYLGGLSTISINEHSIHLGIFGYIFGILFIVWLTNLYNFMDGTDGFAGVQTISVSLFCMFLSYHLSDMSLSLILLCLASSTIGFLCWNWAPAKIFMGDVGSCSIGFLFASLAIYTEITGIIPLSVWLILLSPFIGDASFTLLFRMLKNEKWYEAHNSHAYQILYRYGVTHHNLALGLIVIHIFIIWPLAYITYRFNKFESLMLLLTYSIMGIMWLIIQKKVNR